ncbi:hypothetical protein Nepgr_002633 [Nepenthes gracilis]|uniref:Uncharacterized protein n=1 Tax=Nepenthes gracilis TaxID=150966 RepID=A0AAD3P6N3_NEPGR|nr:hypothetical protein Nepgr_002633 [Nepenthes gracilis]
MKGQRLMVLCINLPFLLKSAGGEYVDCSLDVQCPILIVVPGAGWSLKIGGNNVGAALTIPVGWRLAGCLCRLLCHPGMSIVTELLLCIGIALFFLLQLKPWYEDS